MSSFPEGNTIVYCEKHFGTSNGKTAHGLVRRTARYRVLSVIDSCHAGEDAGIFLDGKCKNIPIFPDIQLAVEASLESGNPATHLVIGLAPDGGRLSQDAREDIKKAIRLGLNVDSGLHDFISEDPIIQSLAKEYGVHIRDIRKTPPLEQLHFFTGKIDEVKALKIAVLGTDSAVGKRTTAWLLVDALNAAGIRAEMVGTGQTAWMQGVKYGFIMDTMINDYLSGEIEHAVWSAWDDTHPDVVVIEGQGSLLNPAYPGGYEILAPGRPDVVVLQHAPTRKLYDGFPQYAIHPLPHQIQAIQVVSSKPVVAISINHENLTKSQIPRVCKSITKETGLPAFDVLLNGADGLVEVLRPYLRNQLISSSALLD